MRNIDKRPWSVGGTLIATRYSHHWPLYLEALRRYNGPLTLFPWNDSCHALQPQELWYLHCLSPAGADLAPFWNLFMELEKQYNDTETNEAKK